MSISCKLRSFIIIVKLNIDDFAKAELFGFAIFRVSELFGKLLIDAIDPDPCEPG